MSNDTATAARRSYAVMVKGPNGRKWFRADSAQCADADFVAAQATDCQQRYGALGLKFMASNHPADLAAPAAPAKYRPWDASGDVAEDEVNLDELPDSEL